MDTLRNVLLLVLVIFQAFRIHSQCLPGCSCISDRQGRSLTCMENAFQGIPVNVPEDMTKIRIEKSSFREIPSGAFLQLASLESLWLNFNDITVLDVKCLAGLGNLTELRLQGNKLRSVPWTAFEDTPALNILDLKHNRLDVLPEYALKYLPGLTYLDVSFNQLTIVSKDVFLNWPLYQRIQNSEEREKGFIPNVVLALHDNAWLCDCRLKGFVEFVRSLSPPIILMNSYLSCAGPDFKAGKFFHDVALQVCMKPVASTGAANLTMPLAESVTFRCVAKGRPVPAVWWTYGLKIIRGFHESQERVDEDTISTQLVIPSVQLADRGVYTCTANNFLGNSSVGIQLDVLTQDGVRSAAPPGGSVPAIASEEYVYIDLRITKQTVYGITIEWYAAIDRTTETWFTVHFGMAGVGKKELIYIGPGINSYTVADLMPATKYEICVTIKNQAPRPGQCVVFVTGNDISELEQRQKLIHIIVIVLGMVLAVPAGMFACTTDVRLNCVERFLEFWRSRRRGAEELERAGSGDRQWAGQGDRQCTFDSLQAASDEGLVRDSTDDNKKLRRRSEDKTVKGKDQSRITELLY